MSPRTSRRTLLKAGGVGATGLVLGPGLAARPALAAQAPTDPFTLGVASGDPTPSGVLLWTRLAPDPLTPDGGMPDRNFQVLWQVATDERFTDVVRAGSVVAETRWAHSMHVEVTGLLPDRVYYYRFRVGSQLSPVGRTRTFPQPGTAMQSLSFAAVSCQSFPNGRYAAYRHLAATDLDLVVHLGDYIYEDAGSANPAAGKDRAHLPFKVATTLEEHLDAQRTVDAALPSTRVRRPGLAEPARHPAVPHAAGRRPGVPAQRS